MAKKRRNKSKTGRPTEKATSYRKQRAPLKSRYPEGVLSDGKDRKTYEHKRPKADPFRLADRRTFHPDGHNTDVLITGRISQVAHRTNLRQPEKISDILDRMRFVDPKRTIVCRKRADRRRALFAQGKAGSGKKIRTRKKYLPHSRISCKRS